MSKAAHFHENSIACSFSLMHLHLMNVYIFSMSEIQNARGIMDVLAEMLNALDPGNREVPKYLIIPSFSTEAAAQKIDMVPI